MILSIFLVHARCTVFRKFLPESLFPDSQSSTAAMGPHAFGEGFLYKVDLSIGPVLQTGTLARNRLPPK